VNLQRLKLDHFRYFSQKNFAAVAMDLDHRALPDQSDLPPNGTLSHLPSRRGTVGRVAALIPSAKHLATLERGQPRTFVAKTGWGSRRIPARLSRPFFLCACTNVLV